MSVQVKALQQSIPGPILCHSGESERKALVSVEERNRSGGRYMLGEKQEAGTMSPDAEQSSDRARPGPKRLRVYESGPIPGHFS